MELTPMGRLRREAQTARTEEKTGKTQGRKTAGGGLVNVHAQQRADRLTVSRQALSFLEEQNRRALEQEQNKQEKTAEESMLDFYKKAQKELDKCQKIAARIMAGDKVPPEDEIYLMEHDDAGYKLAQALKKPKEHPKEWKSVLEDEDKQPAGVDGGGAGSGTEIKSLEPAAE